MFSNSLDSKTDLFIFPSIDRNPGGTFTSKQLSSKSKQLYLTSTKKNFEDNKKAWLFCGLSWKNNPLQKDTTYSVTSCKLVSAKQLFRLMMMNHRSRSSQLFQRFVRLFVRSFVRLYVCSFVRLFVCSNVLFVHSFPLSLKTFPSETSLQETAMSNYFSPPLLVKQFC